MSHPDRNPRPPARTNLRFAALALASLAGAASAQYGTIVREQKLAAASGNLGPILGNDYRFGVSVADLGDFDGDGIRDLLAGAHRANRGGVERGAVWILLLNANGTVKSRQEISAVAGGLPGPVEDHDRFGISACALGDLDLDGTTDIAVGAYRDDDGGLDHGAVYVLFLNPSGTVKAQQKISGTSGGLVATLDQEDSFGWSVEPIGDLDGDGILDLAVGATRDDGAEADLLRDYGAVYLLQLRRDGTVKATTRLAADTPPFGSALRPGDRFGADVALLGDLDGDGVEDIAVGAFGDDPLKSGRVLVMPLNANGTVKSFIEIGASLGGFTGSLGKSDRFGISLASDDLDGDGIQDLLVGAVGDDDGGADAGALWVLKLDATGHVTEHEKISPDFG
ncbi:MAG: integrin alpha, partial [Planctomycetota bacterium]